MKVSLKTNLHVLLCFQVLVLLALVAVLLTCIFNCINKSKCRLVQNNYLQWAYFILLGQAFNKLLL